MDNYYQKYIIMKNKYLKLKEKYNNMTGGMGYNLSITNGYSFIRISGFTQLIKLKKKLASKQNKDFKLVIKKIDKYINEESYPNENISVINVSNDIFNKILHIAKYLKITF
jgi:hypothetical protein